MADAITIKQHDLYPPLQFTLSDANGPVDLSTAESITLLMKSGGTVVDGTCTADADQVTNKGVATYTWVSGDTDTAGTYDVEFEVAWPDGIETFPNTGYLSIVIEPDLGPVA